MFKLLSIFLVFVLTQPSLGQSKTYKKVLKLMGSRFEITAVHDDEVLAWNAINKAIDEITRIEKMISSWDPNSQTSAINLNAGVKPEQVDPELFQLIYRSKKVSHLTEGAFDISYASVDPIWKFDGTMTTLPANDLIEKSVSKIDYNNIILNEENHTIFLKLVDMKIGFGAIGKGYAANQSKQIMQKMGIENGVVNAGGDLLAWGKDEHNQPWKIAIANPKNKTVAIGWLQLNDLAVVTSGNYEKFVTISGKQYSHIIDPRTGYPVMGLKSVTIVCKDAELADALATSVFVMGKQKGMELINTMKGLEGLIIDHDDKLFVSKNLKLNYYD